jgi:asparagine N-glycosylation enzyme membrane subunit Stt3
LKVFVRDPYSCGGDIVGDVTSLDVSKTTVTVALSQNKTVKKTFTPVLDSKGNYVVNIEYSNKAASNYVSAGEYDVIVTAMYSGSTDTLIYKAKITDACSKDPII